MSFTPIRLSKSARAGIADALDLYPDSAIWVEGLRDCDVSGQTNVTRVASGDGTMRTTLHTRVLYHTAVTRKRSLAVCQLERQNVVYYLAVLMSPNKIIGARLVPTGDTSITFLPSVTDRSNFALSVTGTDSDPHVVVGTLSGFDLGSGNVCLRWTK